MIISICPFHPDNKSSSYCLIGDCFFDDEEHCPIVREHYRILNELRE